MSTINCKPRVFDVHSTVVESGESFTVSPHIEREAVVFDLGGVSYAEVDLPEYGVSALFYGGEFADQFREV